jgi:hypothetical protein
MDLKNYPEDKLESIFKVPGREWKKALKCTYWHTFSELKRALLYFRTCICCCSLAYGLKVRKIKLNPLLADGLFIVISQNNVMVDSPTGLCFMMLLFF